MGTISLQKKRLCLILTIITILVTGYSPVHGQDDIDLHIINVDSSNFPTIEVDFLPLQGNLVVPLADASEVSLSDDIKPDSIQLESIEERPTVFGLVIETSVGGELDQLKEAALAFLRDVYQDGDILFIYYSSNAGFRVDNRADAEARIANITLENRSLGATLDAVRNEVLAYDPNNELVNRQVILFGSLVFSTAGLDTGAIARTFLERDVPIYSAQIHDVGERGGSTQYYQALGEGSGGQFYDLQGSSNISGDLAPMFAAMNQNRHYYRLSYISQSQSIESERNISLTLNTALGSVRETFQYEPTFLPPIPTIVNSNTSPSRSILNGEYSPTEVTLAFQVAYPDGMPRDVVSVTLDVLNADTLTPLQPPTIINNPTVDEDGNFTVDWDLRGYNQANSTTPIKLVVKVRDVLGMEGEGEQFGQIYVGINPTNTPVPTNTVPPTNTPIPTNTPLPTPTPVAIGPGNLTAEEADKLILLNLVLLAVVIGVAIVALYLLFTRRGREVVSKAARSTSAMVARSDVYKRATEIFGVSSFEEPKSSKRQTRSKPIAYLYPLRGTDDMTPIPITKREFSFGRAADLCDYAIPKSYISAEHFRIKQRGNGFVLADMGSSNGTYVDSTFLQNNEAPLRAGAVIKVVDLEFQFQPEPENASSPQTDSYAPSTRPAAETEVFGQPSTSGPGSYPTDEEPIEDLFNPKRRNPGMGPRNMFGSPDDSDDESNVDPNWEP